MNKTYNMNLGSMPFQIDDEAYEKLNAYLEAVKRKFSHVQGHNEIVEDIEARMAEMFQENLHSSSRKIVSLRDVDGAIEAMGRPEEFEQGYEDEETTYAGGGAAAATGGTERSNYRVGKKLYRDPDDKVLGGVISGLSQYFGLDSPTWIRVIWAALPFLDIFFAGISTTFVVLAYVVLWIAVPKAQTATQKMQMRGERVNLDNIERKFNDGFDEVKKNLNNDGTRNTGRGAGEVLGAMAIGFGKLLLIFGLFIAGLVALGLIVAFFAGIIGVGASAPFLSSHIFGNGWMGWTFIIGLLLICFAPLVFIITLLLKILFKNKTNMPAIAFGTLGAFILGWILTSFTGVSLVKDFSENSSLKETVSVESASEFYLYGNENIDSWTDGGTIGFDKSFMKQNVDLHILPSRDSLAHLEIKKYAQGKTSSLAKKRAENIEYDFEVNGNRMTFNDELMLGKKDLWRNQEVDIYLRVPDSTVLHFDESVEGVLAHGVSFNDYWRSDNAIVDQGKWLVSHTDGLIPLDAEGNQMAEEKEYDNDEFRWEGNGNIEIEGERDHVEINLFGREILKVDVLENDSNDRVRVRIGDKKILEINVDESGSVVDIDEVEE